MGLNTFIYVDIPEEVDVSFDAGPGDNSFMLIKMGEESSAVVGFCNYDEGVRRRFLYQLRYQIDRYLREGNEIVMEVKNVDDIPF